jgi:hypothetical protein
MQQLDLGVAVTGRVPWKIERERNRYVDEVPAASVVTFNTHGSRTGIERLHADGRRTRRFPSPSRIPSHPTSGAQDGTGSDSVEPAWLP